jgi:hypothetical protein
MIGDKGVKLVPRADKNKVDFTTGLAEQKADFHLYFIERTTKLIEVVTYRLRQRGLRRKK